jgi:hypothetical protein
VPSVVSNPIDFFRPDRSPIPECEVPPRRRKEQPSVTTTELSTQRNGNMHIEADYTVQIGRWFASKRIRKPGVTKDGKAIYKRKSVPVTVRRLFVSGRFLTTSQYRCVLVLRRGAVSYSVSYLAEPAKPLWPTLTLRPEPEPTWEKWLSMDEREFTAWLSRILGPERARLALSELKAATDFAARIP